MLQIQKEKFYFNKSISDEDGFVLISIPPGAYEIEKLTNEIERINIVEEHFTEANYPFTIKPNFSTLRSIIATSEQGPLISFFSNDSIRDLVGFNAITIYDEYNLSPNPGDILLFDNIFLECDIARAKIFKGK